MDTGIDVGDAISSTEAVHALNAIGGTFLGIYFDAPCHQNYTPYTPALVRAYAAAGITAFLPIYLGQQAAGICSQATLTVEQAAIDAQEAVSLMQQFGWGPGAPCVLDVEPDQFGQTPVAAIPYTDRWCQVVRRAGYSPGAYGLANFIVQLQGIDNPPDFVWVANYLAAGVFDPSIDPAHIPHLPDSAWKDARGWQYVGDGPLGSLKVDISAVNFPLASAPAGATPHTGVVDQSHRPYLHVAPDRTSDYLAVLEPGTSLIIVGTAGDYLQVQVQVTGRALQGYVFAAFVQVTG